MSALLPASTWVLAGLVSDDDQFVAPGPPDFWQELVAVGDGTFSLTRPSVLAMVSAGILIWFFMAATRRMTLVPSKTQMFVESIYGFVRNTIGRDIIGAKDFVRYLPLLFTIFTFILLNNLFGVIPFIQFPTFSRIGFPIALTLIVYVVYHVAGIRAKGGFFKWIRAMIPPGVPRWVLIILAPLEIAKYFITQPLTLALRLFGNMFAGHLLILVFALGGEYLLIHGAPLIKVAGVLSFLFTIVMTFFELLVEFLQAFVFTLLAALYIADALSEEH